MNYNQLELITPDMMIGGFRIGWYYGYNPEKKPYKGTIMSVCKVIAIADTGIGQRLEIQIIGDVGTRPVHQDELAPIIFLNRPDYLNFTSVFEVLPEQAKEWGYDDIANLAEGAK